MIRFNLEDLNRLEFFDSSGSPLLQGVCNLLVTGADHPYGQTSGLLDTLSVTSYGQRLLERVSAEGMRAC